MTIHEKDGYAQAVICNSGNANTCNANGVEIAEQTCALLSASLHVDAQDVIVASTGVIGEPLDITPIKNGIPSLVNALGENGSADAAQGIMTTDTVAKEIAVSFEISGKPVTSAALQKAPVCTTPIWQPCWSF